MQIDRHVKLDDTTGDTHDVVRVCPEVIVPFTAAAYASSYRNKAESTNTRS